MFASCDSLVNAVALFMTIATVRAFPSTEYTLTAYKPGDAMDGLKVNWGGALNLYQQNVSSYCPSQVEQEGLCPNGTDTVFANSMYPISEVPGGQDLFVYANGLISITVQHSHTIPPDAYWEYQGWRWYELSDDSTHCAHCPKHNPLYNCGPRTGFATFKLENETTGGVVACTNPYDNQTISLYAVTPEFNRTDCTTLKGLATHNYTGVNPPVWAY